MANYILERGVVRSRDPLYILTPRMISVERLKLESSNIACSTYSVSNPIGLYRPIYIASATVTNHP